ncbi:GNAT family N-acetyltransferase [Kribbella sp. NPDC051770]|uniref:GNAT family N-acetyltransferase n=1 Tax=Kribbella sp. NPDC051770 TaxID=3155413 RepID=UPI003423DA09
MIDSGNDRGNSVKDLAATVESVEQLALVWREVALDRTPRADVRDLPGIAVRWAGSGFVFWNVVTLTEPRLGEELLKQRLHEAADVLRAGKGPGLLWLFTDLLDERALAALDSTAEEAGLQFAFGGTGMAGDLLPLPEPTHPDLTFVRVSTEDHLRAYADLNADAYDMPREVVREGLTGSKLFTEKIHAYLALRSGEPVACAGAIEADGRLFLILVATRPGHQRHGYGEAVSRKALYEGAQATGLRRATLHATEAGAPVYTRIGFEPISPIRFYGLAD